MLAEEVNGNDRADVDERYAVATNARTLEVARHHAGPVDVLAAAAWSPTRIGAQLLRLHSEFDGGQRATQAVRMQDGKQMVPSDTKLLAIRLRSMRAAREQLTMQAQKWLMEEAESKAQSVINWWLDRQCPKCQGRKWKSVNGTPHLSGQTCPPRQRGGCGGTGEIAIPHGHEGKRLAIFMDDCVSRARQSIKQRLRGS